ncbi:MAG: hypothetical protein EPN82_08725 [Bacteroidetes bacterium]|nr:MAG: hypothetical protein EPN82_08725 [Bacteroidota bacterium]
MELDDYISKYIDSELTDEEDVLLRNLLSEDEFSRDKFDSAVTVHLAMKEDSQSIEPPEDIFRQTEDIVLMKILASQPIIAERPFFRRRTQVLAAMIVFFIFSFVFQIDDMQLGWLNTIGNFSNSISNPTKHETINENNNLQNITASGERIVRNRGVSNLAILSKHDNDGSTLASTAGGAGIRSIETNHDGLRPIENRISAEISKPELMPAPPIAVKTDNEEKKEVLKPSVTLNSSGVELNKLLDKDTDDNIIIKNSTENIIAKDTKSEIKLMKLNYENTLREAVNDKTNIIFSSFLGTDVIRTGFNDNEKLAITNFSQSVAYSINDYEKMGIEIGYSEYAYKENVVMPSPYHSLKNVKSQSIETAELINPIGVDMFESSVTFNRQQQFVWGSAFYERSIIKSQDMALEGRIGIGMSHDGPLGYGRLFGKYNFLNGFSVTVGTEGRVFQTFLPGEDVNKKLRSTTTIIYGFQINF